MTPSDLHLSIQATLRELSLTEKLSNYQRFFKEGEAPLSYGLSMTTAHSVGKEVISQVKSWPKSTIFETCQLLLSTLSIEEAIIACDLAYSVRKKYTIDDFLLFESWIQKYITNWASCDTFCTKNIGHLIISFPDLVPDISRWALSPNRWLRRAAAVSFISPAKKGLYLPDIFHIATLLLQDDEDLVQKGYGWMLKSASKTHEEKVFEWILDHKHSMPRTALRYAIEKMPIAYRNEAMSR